jgi:hypothetical protein
MTVMVLGERHSALESIIWYSGEADVLKAVLPHCAQCEA